jgi:WD40 repeat protein
VQSHLGDVTAVALNHEGTLLATASNKGLVIRIFSADNGQLIQELRRGTDRADIFGLSFDLVSKYLGVSSDKGTVHLFTVRKDVSLEAMTAKQLSIANQAVTPLP